MTRNQKWLLGIFLAGFALVAGLMFVLIMSTLFTEAEVGLSDSFGDRIGIIELQGTIDDSEPYLRQIKTFRDDSSVRGVVLRIDSPGGAVAPSQEIYQQLLKLRQEAGKPVVVSMGSVAASGGYYVACAADSILALPGTLTGSIGVLMEFPDIHEVMGKIGVGMEVVKSAPHKDIGSPFRPLTDEERKLLQSMVDDVYRQFVEVVSTSRHLPMDSVLAIADGRVVSGNQAREMGLVDGAGGLPEAIAMAGRMCGLGDNPKVVRPRRPRPSLVDLLNDTATKLNDPAASLGSPRLMYLFR
jgi:protease IV